MLYSRIAISVRSTDLEHLRTLVRPQGKSVAEYIVQLIRADLAILNAGASSTNPGPMLQILTDSTAEDMSQFGVACRKMGIN